ncbi:Protein farnesyltransferase/geranylgeranyltransferase type-1 subunit alpha [Grifola frondosa]|uniref:Protein farnesyltransferase/geranylgeranyltransferase type-1 subunit alpha n=1 Tax=Grifola frondosa TaxID=5627 RepID=A0A1C7LTE7_GRIFR|nr:Protein farnesyltransferase/geranylgeranyltransferase type-1 subunit alpha [Grifola frondosa]
MNPIAPIFYTEEYKDATDYFRGIVKSGETSSRVLELTEHIIRMNPAHYSAWQYRYKTLLALHSPLDEELRLMDALAIQFLKTYQVWHHRRLLLTALNSVPAAEAELAFIRRAVAVDTKNYYTPGRTDKELLEADVRNNSAWHHRFFVVFQSGVRKGDEDRELVLRRELAFTKEKIALAPNNPSAWNYLRGILEYTKTPFSTITTFVEPYASTSRSSTAEQEIVIDLENPYLRKEGGASTMKAVEIWRSLANVHDTVRKKYWEHRIKDALSSIQK